MTDTIAISTPLARRLAAIIAIVATAAIIIQLGLNFARAAEKGTPLWMAPVDLYGFFTIWSNTLVALITARFARGGDTKGLLGRPWLLAAGVVYIVVVGVIYNALLAPFNVQTGVRKAIDVTFHTLIPIAYPLWWLTQIPRRQLEWNALLPALIFPMAYSAVAMTKGAVTGKYAYFFIDIGKYGVGQVLLNSVGLAALYAVLMAVVIAFDRRAGATAAMGPAE
ncbi:MAG: Pr6Pr family membrane protein [Sandarakinorhabdus sp.]|nr:Pr6Pr family membrane protein [Sandarakinorhabdus sp.]